MRSKKQRSEPETYAKAFMRSSNQTELSACKAFCSDIQLHSRTAEFFTKALTAASLKSIRTGLPLTRPPFRNNKHLTLKNLFSRSAQQKEKQNNRTYSRMAKDQTNRDLTLQDSLILTLPLSERFKAFRNETYAKAFMRSRIQTEL